MFSFFFAFRLCFKRCFKSLLYGILLNLRFLFFLVTGVLCWHIFLSVVGEVNWVHPILLWVWVWEFHWGRLFGLLLILLLFQPLITISPIQVLSIRILISHISLIRHDIWVILNLSLISRRSNWHSCWYKFKRFPCALNFPV